jgi:hypothetical protein
MPRGLIDVEGGSGGELSDLSGFEGQDEAGVSVTT